MSKKKAIASSVTLFCVLVICLLPRTSTGELPIGEALSVGEFSVFENIYIRETGPPITETDTFTIPNPNSKWILRAITGNINDDNKNVSSFTLTLNGKKVLKPNQFNQNVNLVEVPVTLFTTNTVVANLAGKPGGLLALMIIGTDQNAPGISIQNPSDGELMAKARPTISGEYSDDISGINSDRFVILLDDIDVTSKTFVSINSFEFIPRIPINDGIHTLNVSVEDNAGNKRSGGNQLYDRCYCPCGRYYSASQFERV